MPTMFLHVTDVKYLAEYKVRVTFNDGVTKDIDLTQELYGEVFEPLKDNELFRKVAVNPEMNTIEWPNGADFAPEFLYEIGQEVELGDLPIESTEKSSRKGAKLVLSAAEGTQSYQREKSV